MWVKKRYAWENYIWSPATFSCDDGKYLLNIIDNSLITCDEIVEEKTKTFTTNFNEKNTICKTKIYIFCLYFY